MFGRSLVCCTKREAVSWRIQFTSVYLTETNLLEYTDLLDLPEFFFGCCSYFFSNMYSILIIYLVDSLSTLKTVRQWWAPTRRYKFTKPT